MDGAKGWEKQMVPDRDALQGDLDFILGRGKGQLSVLLQLESLQTCVLQ